MSRTYSITERQAELAHALTRSHIQALHNWAASAVEAGDLPRAQKLVAEIREHQRLFADTNVEAHKQIDEAKAKAKRENEVA